MRIEMMATLWCIIATSCCVSYSVAQQINWTNSCSSSSTGYADPNNCQLVEAKHRQVKVMYLEKPFTTQNNPARAAAAQVSGIHLPKLEKSHDAQPKLPRESLELNTVATILPLHFLNGNSQRITFNCLSNTEEKISFVAANWAHGWVGRFMWDVFQELKLDQDIIVYTQANFSGDTDPRNASSPFRGVSAFTRCVWEVKLGLIVGGRLIGAVVSNMFLMILHQDMCVGDFWETEERRNLSYFTTPFGIDQFMLVTLAQQPEDSAMFPLPHPFVGSSVVNIFLPFDLTVWVLNIAMIWIGGVALWYIDGIRQETFESSLQAALVTTYNAAKLLFAPGRYEIPSSMGGKIALMGLSFHLFIITASYTAALAEYLATQVSVSGVVDDIVQLNISNTVDWSGKLCMLQSMEGLIMIDPSQVVGMDNYGPMFEKLYNKGCGAAVTGKNEYLLYIEGENEIFNVCGNVSDPYGFATCKNGGAVSTVNLYQCTCKDPSLSPDQCPIDCPNYLKYCNVIIPSQNQDGFHASLNWALPVAEQYVEVISYMILTMRLQGDLISSRQSQLLDVTPIRCSAAARSTLDIQITIGDMMGVYVYTSGTLVIGLLLNCWQKRSASPVQKGSPSTDFSGRSKDNSSIKHLKAIPECATSESLKDSVKMEQLNRKLQELQSQMDTFAAAQDMSRELASNGLRTPLEPTFDMAPKPIGPLHVQFSSKNVIETFTEDAGSERLDSEPTTNENLVLAAARKRLPRDCCLFVNPTKGS